MKIDTAALEADLVSVVNDHLDETREAKRIRKYHNRKNSDVYNGRSRLRKKRGRSNIFIHKAGSIVETLISTLAPAMAKVDVDMVGGFEDDVFVPELVKGIMKFYLEKADFDIVGPKLIKNLMLEGTATAKVGMSDIKVPSLGRAKKTYKCLKVWDINFDDFDFDPEIASSDNNKLYEIHKITIDKWRLIEKAKDPVNKYELDIIEELKPSSDPHLMDKDNKANRPHRVHAARRNRIVMYEFWGTVLTKDGDIMKDPVTKQPLENVTFTIANGRLIRKPQFNPRWSKNSPFITGNALLTSDTIYPKAPMDASADLSITLSGIFNLMVDGGVSSVFGIRALRPHLLADPRQVADGIPAQSTLIIREDAPSDEKVFERVDTGSAPNDILPFYNIIDGLISENSLLNDPLSGGLAARKPLATELNQAMGAVNTVLERVVTNIVNTFIEPLAEEMWYSILQYIDEFPEDDLVRIVSLDTGDVERARELVTTLNSMSKKERFTRGAAGFKFVGIGMLETTRRLQDLQKYQQTMGLISSSEFMFAEFKKGYSLTRLMEQTFQAMSLDVDQIKKTDREIAQEQRIAEIREKALMDQELQGNGASQARPVGAAGVPNIPQETPQPGQS